MWLAAGAGPALAEKTELERHGSMTWAQRLKRVFVIEIERCLGCGGRLKVIASIEQPNVIERILAHLGEDRPAAEPGYRSASGRVAPI